MLKIIQVNPMHKTGKTMGILATIAFAIAMIFFIVPVTVYAYNTSGNSNNFSNPNWQNTHHYDYWNWQYNWAYQAPEYEFETTYPYDQWGRPTTSNVAPDHPQNIRRDRHSAALPPTHGSQTGFFSGEFATEQVNPFAPRYNNNPNASRAVQVEESVFAVLPGETGVNVRAEGSHSGGFLASTSVNQSGGGSNNAPQDGFTGNSNPSWANTGTQIVPPNPPQGNNQSGVTITHTPMPETSQTGNQSNRVITVTPFSDGTIGRITIPALNMVASVRPGVAMSTLDNYVGHFSNTSQWDGNIALASHNRGRGSFFAGIWTLQYGDRIIYETTMGVRIFEVVSITQISETDLSNLNHSFENFLTLVTCVYGNSSLCWSLNAKEIFR